jgi:hypothetical protein
MQKPEPTGGIQTAKQLSDRVIDGDSDRDSDGDRLRERLHTDVEVS